MALNKQYKYALNLHRCGEFDNTLILYQQLFQDFPEAAQRYDILYNTALCCISLGNFELAQDYLEKTLTQKPDHADALNNLGALLLKKQLYTDALQCFSAVLSFYPDHLESRNNLAALLLEQGKYLNAAKHYEILLSKTPDDPDIHYSYGICLLESGKFLEAINIFEQVLVNQPNHINSLCNLGIAYLKSGHILKARILFKSALDKNPDQAEINFLYHAVSQENTPAKPPMIYVQHLFDQYARYYDSHMLDTLGYQVPEKLYNLLTQYLTHDDIKYHILDLGCGSGLSGLAFVKRADSLTGIDISSKMLALAKQKNIYTLLIEQELILFLKQAVLDRFPNTDINTNINTNYHLIIAADTLNYIGDLSEIFQYSHQLLKFSLAAQPDIKPYFLFSLETDLNNYTHSDSPIGWRLNTNARYTHTQIYIENLASQYNFKITAIEQVSLRVQNYLPVNGYLCLLSL